MVPRRRLLRKNGKFSECGTAPFIFPTIFTLLLGYYLLFVRRVFTKLRAGKLSRWHNNLDKTDDNMGLTVNFPASAELHNVCVCEFKIFVFESWAW
jgi:hypothetical protein